jgi:hypothetical protein
MAKSSKKHLKKRNKKVVKSHPWIGRTIRIKTNGHYEEFVIKEVFKEMVRVHNGVYGLDLPYIQVEIMPKKKQ